MFAKAAEIILNSFGLVALAEMGDKTQLLAFILAARFKKPWPILAGIFVATVLNHGLASWVGLLVADFVSQETLRWILALTFIAFGIWILVPDKEEELQSQKSWGAFLTTLVAFFLAEMGDKTQLATVALAARYQDLLWVSVGTTLGMLFSNGLAVFFGPWVTQKIPFKVIRIVTALLFFVFGVGILLMP
jgi:putative Ca2+/H+ antiporter (TMEM165/GDT1 family)